MCFRRFNATHQFGCQSRQGGSVGTVHLVRNADDIELIVNSGANQPYVPCLSSRFFTQENLVKFRDSGRVSGLILFDSRSDPLPDSFTEDRRCPNEMTSYYRADPTYGHCRREEWNKYASFEAISELNLDFPMILMRDQSNITSIRECFQRFNEPSAGQRPSGTTSMLCSLELKTWMVGAKNSKTCMSRSTSGLNFESVGYCDSVASLNLFSSLFKYEKDDKIDDRSVLVLASRIDSLSIFDNAATGASTTLTALITLFSVMQILREQRDGKTPLERMNRKNVLYTLFDGEAFDYVGSGRMAFDLGTDGLQALLYSGQSFENLKFFKHHLHSAIEINQATLDDTSRKFYIHTDPLTREKPSIKKELDKLVRELIQPELIDDAKDANLPLPPSSVQQLLAHDPDLPVLVISNHKSDYVNKFYNSFLDDKRTIGDRKGLVISKIAALSESIARTVIAFLDNKDRPLKADQQLIARLYECFIENSKCPFFEDIRGAASRLSPAFTTYPMYITTTRIELRELVPFHFEYLYTLSRLSAYLNGKNQTNTRSADECKELNKKVDTNSTFNWFEIRENPLDNTTTHGTCMESTDFISLARSPVFAFEQPNWSLNYSTWTESVWNSPTVRLFVASSKLQEYLTFFIGLLILVASFLISRWVCSKADVLFVDLRIDNNVAVSM